MNQLGLVGRLVRSPEVRDGEGKRSFSWVTLAITRGFKNASGEYETDFIDVMLFDNVAENTAKHCRKGDIISVRGRLRSRIIDKDGEKRYVLEVIGERVTFISHVHRQDDVHLHQEEDEEESFSESKEESMKIEMKNC